MNSFLLLPLILSANPISIVENRRANEPEKQIRAEVSVDQESVSLSGQILLRINIEGPSPLEVTPPKTLLSSNGLWRVNELGLPLREVISERRQLWTKRYRLSPLVPGERVPINLESFKIQSGVSNELMIQFEQALFVKVTTQISDPNLDDWRPSTGIETTPNFEPPEVKSSPIWKFLAIGLLAIIGGWYLHQRKKTKSEIDIHNATWFVKTMAACTSAEQLFPSFREWLSYEFHSPMQAMTTVELVKYLNNSSILSAGTIQLIDESLTLMDQARFTGNEVNIESYKAKLQNVVISLLAYQVRNKTKTSITATSHESATL